MINAQGTRIFFLPHFTYTGGSGHASQLPCGTNSCPVPTKLIPLSSHKPHHQRYAISIPFPLPLHLPFPFLFSSSSKREPQMSVSFFFFFLQNFPRLCHTPPPIMPGEVGEPRGTIEVITVDNHNPVTYLYRDHVALRRLAAWRTVHNHEHGGQSKGDWFASFGLTVQSRQCFWACKPEGAEGLPPTWSARRGRDQELVGRCGKPCINLQLSKSKVPEFS